MYIWSLFTQLFDISSMNVSTFYPKTAERFYVKMVVHFSKSYFSLLLIWNWEIVLLSKRWWNWFVNATSYKKVLEGIPNRLRNSLSFRKKTRKCTHRFFFFTHIFKPRNYYIHTRNQGELGVWYFDKLVDFLNCECIKLLKYLFAFECIILIFKGPLPFVFIDSWRLN